MSEVHLPQHHHNDCRLALEAEWWVLGDNWESSVLFFVVFYQYITCALVYSFGSSFRLTLFYNWAVVVRHHLTSMALTARVGVKQEPWLKTETTC